MASEKYKLEQLNDYNYDYWYTKIESALKDKKLDYLLFSKPSSKKSWEIDTNRALNLVSSTLKENDSKLFLSYTTLHGSIQALFDKYKRSKINVDKNKKKISTNQNKRKKHCKYCKMNGHLIDDCFKLKKINENYSSSNSQLDIHQKRKQPLQTNNSYNNSNIKAKKTKLNQNLSNKENSNSTNELNEQLICLKKENANLKDEIVVLKSEKTENNNELDVHKSKILNLENENDKLIIKIDDLRCKINNLNSKIDQLKGDLKKNSSYESDKDTIKKKLEEIESERKDFLQPFYHFLDYQKHLVDKKFNTMKFNINKFDIFHLTQIEFKFIDTIRDRQILIQVHEKIKSRLKEILKINHSDRYYEGLEQIKIPLALKDRIRKMNNQKAEFIVKVYNKLRNLEDFANYQCYLNREFKSQLNENCIYRCLKCSYTVSKLSHMINNNDNIGLYICEIGQEKTVNAAKIFFDFK